MQSRFDFESKGVIKYFFSSRESQARLASPTIPKNPKVSSSASSTSERVTNIGFFCQTTQSWAKILFYIFKL